MISHSHRLLRAASLLVLIVLPGVTPALAAQPVDFSREILPILSDNCFQCHGPDARARKAKLRLDTPDGALRKGSSIIVPGKSGDSELVRRILGGEDVNLMPPPKSNKKLTPAQIDILKRWIDDGARWGKHWAFEPPQRPAVPQLRNPKIDVRTPIDAFLFARLEKEGLAPSLEADRATLIRRLSLDLTGLPPTPAEVDAFLNDSRPDAYERLVD